MELADEDVPGLNPVQPRLMCRTVPAVVRRLSRAGSEQAACKRPTQRQPTRIKENPMNRRFAYSFASISIASVALIAPAVPALAGNAPAPAVPTAPAPERAVPRGTMGVEVKVYSDLKRWQVNVTDRNADWTERLQPGQSTYFKGNRSGIDDVELETFSNGGKHEVDFSNPTIGSPNASVDGLLNYFSVGEEERWHSGKHTFFIKRHGDRDGNKQFELRIAASGYEG